MDDFVYHLLLNVTSVDHDQDLVQSEKPRRLSGAKRVGVKYLNYNPMKKNKFSLESLKVKSFVTSFQKDQKNTVKGGGAPEASNVRLCEEWTDGENGITYNPRVNCQNWTD